MLLSTSKKLKAFSGKLVLCCVTPNVMDVLKMSGFDHVLEITTSKELALSAFH
ncbi:STAS domain-containing protein [Parachlamydia acanthamoebae]|nr:STAS domain-containing protein [Parachlamydia acanthamoebae]